MASTQDSTCLSFEELPDDSKWIFEAMARLNLAEFGSLSTADQSAVVGLAIHLKRVSQRSEIYQA
jgi:hypothetical protein